MWIMTRSQSNTRLRRCEILHTGLVSELREGGEELCNIGPMQMVPWCRVRRKSLHPPQPVRCKTFQGPNKLSPRHWNSEKTQSFIGSTKQPTHPHPPSTLDMVGPATAVRDPLLSLAVWLPCLPLTEKLPCPPINCNNGPRTRITNQDWYRNPSFPHFWDNQLWNQVPTLLGKKNTRGFECRLHKKAHCLTRCFQCIPVIVPCGFWLFVWTQHTKDSWYFPEATSLCIEPVWKKSTHNLVHRVGFPLKHLLRLKGLEMPMLAGQYKQLSHKLLGLRIMAS